MPEVSEAFWFHFKNTDINGDSPEAPVHLALSYKANYEAKFEYQQKHTNLVIPTQHPWDDECVLTSESVPTCSLPTSNEGEVDSGLWVICTYMCKYRYNRYEV